MVELSARQTLVSWETKTAKEADAHKRACRRLDRMHYMIGIPTVVVSSVVATTVFASLGTEVGTWAKLVVALISVFAAVLSGLQTFFRFGLRAEQHRSAHVALEKVLREIQVLSGSGSRSDMESRLGEINDRLADAQHRAPAPMTRDYLKSHAQ